MTPSLPENSSPFEKLLVDLAASKVDFDLDMFTRMRGKSLEDFRPRLQFLETRGVRIPYLSAMDLISLKEESWREKDQIDVAALRRITGD